MDFVVPSGAAPTVTSRSLLVGWANDQDAWIRQIVSDVIVSRNALTNDQVQTVYQLFLREKALAAGQAISVPLLADGDFAVDTGIALCLLRLCDLKNVNALAEGQAIDFNLRLTIVFGENACGKTGYVRVLKKAAAVRTAEPVLPDVSIARAETRSPSARITFRLGNDEPKETEWNDQAGLAPFNRIDVFDSRATALHVDGDLNYVYTPGELFRFPLVQQAIEGVRARLDQAVRDAAQPSSPFLAHFERASCLYPLIDSLGAATDIAELRKLAHVTDEEERAVATLRAEVEALQTTSPAAQLKLAETSKQNLDVLSRIVSSIGRFDTGAYASALTRLQEAQRKYEQATRDSFAGLAIPGLLQEEWREFIQAGEVYLQTLDQASYPAEDQECLYCRQPLSSEANRLLTKYREYCNNTMRVELDAAQQAVESIRRAFAQNLDLGDAVRRLDESSGSGGIFNAGETSALKALLEQGRQSRRRWHRVSW